MSMVLTATTITIIMITTTAMSTARTAATLTRSQCAMR
ncbi:hypothetical protein U771_07750 [Pseudomonas gorinensis]|uniref:Uncharacterized protein n=1 Tax=Pseudomonas gorinensis TaxID=3240790 RepID=A0ACA7P2W2_9PSED|nr:hypothetical protein U771_07750 [Pseudomonas sp. TKP]